MTGLPGILPQPKTMRRVHQIAGLAILILGLWVIWQALRLRYYTALGPGPGFFSFWLGVILSGLALGMIGTATWARPEPAPHDFFADRKGYARIGAVLLALLAAILLLKPLGYCLTMTGILGFVMFSGGARWPTAVLGGLIGGFGTFYAFVHLLHVPLPPGLLAF